MAEDNYISFLINKHFNQLYQNNLLYYHVLFTQWRDATYQWTTYLVILYIPIAPKETPMFSSKVNVKNTSIIY